MAAQNPDGSLINGLMNPGYVDPSQQTDPSQGGVTNNPMATSPDGGSGTATPSFATFTAGMGTRGNTGGHHAATASSDYSVGDARKAMANAFQTYNGRAATDNELDSMLLGQGWKPGDNWVGQAGLNGVISNLQHNAQTAAAATPASTSTTPAASASSTAGFDPNNPIDAIFIKNHYANNGSGSGFGDLAYWEAHPDQASRLDADQNGKGADQPGPGDSGNTSGRGQSGSQSGAPTSLGSMGSLMSMMMGPIAQGYNAFGGGNVPYDSTMGVPSSNPSDYSTPTPSGTALTTKLSDSPTASPTAAPSTTNAMSSQLMQQLLAQTSRG